MSDFWAGVLFVILHYGLVYGAPVLVLGLAIVWLSSKFREGT